VISTPGRFYTSIGPGQFLFLHTIFLSSPVSPAGKGEQASLQSTASCIQYASNVMNHRK
jgi:hypothetical protein